MTQPQVVVLDYGSGNVHSVCQALEVAGARVILTSHWQQAYESDGLLVPGVGAFDAVMKQLRQVRGGELVDQRLAASKPVFGICVGMQVMFELGVEHGIETAGLAQWPGKVELLDAPVLPHIGWNTLDAPADSRLFAGIGDERFYFVHSYGVKNWKLIADRPSVAPKVTWANYGGSFVAAVENGPLCATQFHPEKSGQAGIQLLKNWITSL
mgnify:CR=1 FL=1